MVTKNEVMEMVNALEMTGDIEVYDDENNEIEITVCDFTGFDDNWCEIDRDYDVKACHELQNWLAENCNEYNEDFYTVYEFDGFVVTWGYASYEI